MATSTPPRAPQRAQPAATRRTARGRRKARHRSRPSSRRPAAAISTPRIVARRIVRSGRSRRPPAPSPTRARDRPTASAPPRPRSRRCRTRGVERREVGAVDPEAPRVPISTSGTSFRTVVTTCTTRLGDAADVDQRQRPDGDQRRRTRQTRDAGKRGSRRSRRAPPPPGVAGPERDPVAPGDDEACELAEPRLGVGIGAAGLGHDPRQPPEDHRQHQRTDRGHSPADQRDRPEGASDAGEEDAGRSCCRRRERGAGDEPEPATGNHARTGRHRLSPPAPRRAQARRRVRPDRRRSAAEMTTARISSRARRSAASGRRRCARWQPAHYHAKSG